MFEDDAEGVYLDEPANLQVNRMSSKVKLNIK